MPKLDDRVRMIIENDIDGVLEDPVENEQEFKKALAKMGIDPNLETVLSFVSGFLVGQGLINIHNTLKLKKDSEEFAEQLNALEQLISRRAWELRDAMIKAHMK